MDELMLMEYLRSKGIGNMSEQEFVHKFREFLHKNEGISHMRYHNEPEDLEYPYDIKNRRGMPMRRSQLGYYDMYAEYPEYSPYSNKEHENQYEGFGRGHRDMDEYPIDINTMHSKRGMSNEHFNESYAKYTVSSMYHTENGRKHVGEKFNIQKAREVQERYRGVIPTNVTIYDIYVAINAQYHDYCELFKSWFGSDIESKIVESAIVFWFKDSDYKKGFKLTEYFKED